MKGPQWRAGSKKEIKMTMTSFATNPSAFRVQTRGNPDENGRKGSRLETFQTPSDSKIADAILVLAMTYLAVLLWI